MKQWKKMLCVMLSFVMIFTTMSIGVSAAADLSKPGGYDSHGSPYLSSAQRATLLLNYVDGILLEKNINESINLGVKTIKVDFRSIDLAIKSIRDILDDSLYSNFKGALGDLGNINGMYIGKCYRALGNDMNMLVNLVNIAYTNQTLVYKFVKGDLSAGSIADAMLGDALDFNIGGQVKDALYENLVNSYVSTCPPDVSADWILQHAIDTYLVGGKDANGIEVEGYLPSMKGKTSFSSYTLYQWIENAANAAMTDYVMPNINTKIKRFIKELAGYTFTDDDDMVGDDSNVNQYLKDNINFDYNFTGYTWGNTTEGIFGQINDFVDKVLNVIWKGTDFWVGGDNSHIISNIHAFALNIYDSFGTTLLPEGTTTKTREQVYAMGTEELVCFVAQAFVERYIDYIVIDRECKTLEELGCYIGIHLAAEIIPSQAYMAKIKNGQVSIGKDLLIQIFTDIGVYYLQANTSITGLQQGASLESNMMAVIRWALKVDQGGNLGGVFQKCDTSGSNPWTILDNTVFKMIPLSYLNGVTGSYDLVMNHIVNAALDLDVVSILSMFYKTSTSVMNKTALKAVLTIANNVLAVVINSAAIPDVSSVELLIYKDYLAQTAVNAVNGIASMGGDLLRSALQFVTPYIGLEDDIKWLHNGAPTGFANKTIDQLYDLFTQYYESMGIPKDVYEKDLSKWNAMEDFEAYTYLKYAEAMSTAQNFYKKYLKAVAVYEAQVEMGYGEYVKDPRLGDEYGQQNINDIYYNLMTSYQGLTQREASMAQLDYIIEQIDEQGYKSTNYPARVWSAFQKAYKHAKYVSEKVPIYDEEDEDEEFPIAKQSMINYVRRELIHAWKLLKNPTADYTALDAAIRAAKAIDTSLYTDDSVAILNYVIGEAEELQQRVLLLSEQGELDSMVKKLQKAVLALVLKAVDSEIISTIEGVTINRDSSYIFGMDAGLSTGDLADILSSSNGGEVRITTADGSDAAGTGTKIELYCNGELVESFDVIVFGDLTGDGMIDEFDFTIIDLYNTWSLEDFDTFPETPYFFAGDVTGDESVDEGDISIVDMVISWVGEIDQKSPYDFVLY